MNLDSAGVRTKGRSGRGCEGGLGVSGGDRRGTARPRDAALARRRGVSGAAWGTRGGAGSPGRGPGGGTGPPGQGGGPRGGAGRGEGQGCVGFPGLRGVSGAARARGRWGGEPVAGQVSGRGSRPSPPVLQPSRPLGRGFAAGSFLPSPPLPFRLSF